MIRRQLLSASRLHVADECPGAFALPAFPTVGGAYAQRGTVIHRFLDEAFKKDRDRALAVVPIEHREICEKIDLDDLAEFMGGEPATEVAVAYSPGTDMAVRLEVLDREYEDVSGWIPGTVDAVVDDGGLRFGDWKTGFLDVANPEENRQFHLYAIALARHLGESSIEGMVIRLDENGDPHIRRHTFDEMDLDAIAVDLRRILDSVALAIDCFDHGVLPSLRTGPHCRYCEAFPSCPAQAGSAQALIEFSRRIPDLTPARAGEAWALIQVVRGALEKVEAVVREMASRAPVPLPGGKELRELKINKEAIDSKIARQVLEEMEKPAAFFAAAKVSKAALEEILGKELSKEVLGRIRDRKGTRTYVETHIKALKPKRDGGLRG